MRPTHSSELPGTWAPGLESSVALRGQEYSHLWEGLETAWGLSRKGCFWEDRQESLGDRGLGIRPLPCSRKAQALSRVPEALRDWANRAGKVLGWPCHCGFSGHSDTWIWVFMCATPAPRLSPSQTFSEQKVQSAQLREDRVFLFLFFLALCGMGQVSYLIPLNLSSSSIKSK